MKCALVQTNRSDKLVVCIIFLLFVIQHLQMDPKEDTIQIAVELPALTTLTLRTFAYRFAAQAAYIIAPPPRIPSAFRHKRALIVICICVCTIKTNSYQPIADESSARLFMVGEIRMFITELLTAR